MATEAPSVLALEAIVLAGGAGQRFGRGKLTAPWRSGALIDGALATALAAPARSVTVVTGADPGVADAVLRFGARSGATTRLRTVHAAHHAEGMAATLRTGLIALPKDASGAFVFLGDMPNVPHEILAALAALFREDGAVAPTFEGRQGHPVLFGARLFPALMALTGDTGARAMLRDLGHRLTRLPTADPGVIFDVDTPDALTRAGRGPG